MTDAIADLQHQIGGAIAQQEHGLGTSPVLDALNRGGITAQDYLDALNGQGGWTPEEGTSPNPNRLAENASWVDPDGTVKGKAGFYSSADKYPKTKEGLQALIMHELLHFMLFRRELKIMQEYATLLFKNGDCDVEECKRKVATYFTRLGFRRKHLKMFYDPLNKVWSVGEQYIDSDEVTVEEMNSIAEYVCNRANPNRPG
ncbi:MAG: hypothetical protein KIS61_34285 [Candidatus Eremiobacteraeota bacterium]|nr:hypothetical protein [Candidatus Eremiobacteraeota bacterium]